MKIGIVSTGDELLRGRTVDTNASWMASLLHERGHAVDRVELVGDDLDAIAETLRRFFDRFDLVLVGGGLGPTVDDLTAEAAAKALGVGLERRPEAEANVRAAFERIGRPMVEVNLKQADLPAGCRVIRNDWGTAPGFECRTPKGRAMFFPGVPRELRPMFERNVLPALPASDSAAHRAVLRCFGIGESDLQQRLQPVSAAHPSVRLGFRVQFPEISLTLAAPDAATLTAALTQIRAVVGSHAFADGEIDLPEALGKALVERKLTIAAAESCTGGLIAHSITEVPGSSRYFLGGIVAYSNPAKTRLLGVEPALLAEHGAVSEPVVRAMAEGARRSFGADVGVATSGIAGPDGGTPEKPVGTVHMAVATADGTTHRLRTFRGFDRERVKRIAAWTVMATALRRIRGDDASKY